MAKLKNEADDWNRTNLIDSDEDEGRHEICTIEELIATLQSIVDEPDYIPDTPIAFALDKPGGGDSQIFAITDVYLAPYKDSVFMEGEEVEYAE